MSIDMVMLPVTSSPAGSKPLRAALGVLCLDRADNLLIARHSYSICTGKGGATCRDDDVAQRRTERSSAGCGSGLTSIAVPAEPMRSAADVAPGTPGRHE